MKRFRLKQGQHEFELPPGIFSIGRSPDCQLTLDDPLVSRRHAVIHVRDDTATLEDLGSRNGLMVNGERIQQAKRVLVPGDRIHIGSQELVIVEAAAALSRTRTASFTQPIPTGALPPIKSDALPSAQRPPSRPTPQPEPETRRASAFTLLFGVANKAFALGKVEEAERILTNLTADWEAQLSTTGPNDVPGGLDNAATLAVQIAGAKGTSDWVDWVFRAYRLSRRVLPTELIDLLHALVRRQRYPATAPLRAYVEALREREQLMNPAERFLLKRIVGLLEVAAAN